MKRKVLCLVTTLEEPNDDIWDQGNWIDTEPWFGKKKVKLKKEHIVPLIDHLHNDKENGQDMPHYHLDDRYVSSLYYYELRIYPHLIKENQTFEYRMLKPQQEFVRTITPVELIAKSKLKHKCIHKGKCPHRGFDLSTVTPDKDGITTCPLHGLKFKDNQLINFQNIK